MRWIIPALCFFGGAMFGMLTMALMVASSREERKEEIGRAHVLNSSHLA